MLPECNNGMDLWCVIGFFFFWIICFQHHSADYIKDYISGRTIEEQRQNFRAQSTFCLKPKYMNLIKPHVLKNVTILILRWHVEGQVGCFICDVFYRHSADPSRFLKSAWNFPHNICLKNMIFKASDSEPSNVFNLRPEKLCGPAQGATPVGNHHGTVP